MDIPSNSVDQGGGAGENMAGAASKSQSRSPLEKLSKEELLTKYRNLIIIAQKAKSAKDGDYQYYSSWLIFHYYN